VSALAFFCGLASLFFFPLPFGERVLVSGHDDYLRFLINLSRVSRQYVASSSRVRIETTRVDRRWSMCA